MRFWLTVWLLLLAAYALFAGEVSLGEALAGVPGAALAACFALALHGRAGRRFSLIAPWPKLVLHTLLSLPVDAVRVGGVLLGTLRRRPAGDLGFVARQPFDPGDAQPRGAARRALVTLCSSLAPNGYVIDMPGGDDAILLHRLAPAPTQTDRKWPV